MPLTKLRVADRSPLPCWPTLLRAATHVLLSLLAVCAAGVSIHGQYNAERETPGPSSRRTGMVITEIMYNPRPVPGVASTNLTHEFIELFNS